MTDKRPRNRMLVLGGEDETDYSIFHRVFDQQLQARGLYHPWNESYFVFNSDLCIYTLAGGPLEAGVPFFAEKWAEENFIPCESILYDVDSKKYPKKIKDAMVYTKAINDIEPTHVLIWGKKNYSSLISKLEGVQVIRVSCG